MAATRSSGFGAALRRLRLAAGLTQEALAERAGVSAKAVSDLERDPARLPRLETVALLADALGLDPATRAHLLAAARPDDAPSARSSPIEHAARDLPRPLTPLFGRTGATDAVAELLRRGDHPDGRADGQPEGRPEGARLLTLTGPGGVGKTRLAIAAAERVADQFGDGALFVDLAPLRDPSLVLPAIAQRLAVDERDKVPLGERLAVALRRKHLLLVLDNVEHLLAARAAVLALLEACPRLVILATSRVALRVRGEREFRVAPLEMPDAAAGPEDLARSPAAALFLDRARAAGADLALTAETATAVAEICRRLDGLPLAVELAAAWTRLLPPPALLARLERRLPLLVGGPHDLPARQRTMRDAIAWSDDLLNAPEQRLFRRLCIFVGGFTPEAVAEVCADAAADTVLLTGLAALVDTSLVRPRERDQAIGAEPRLTILETVREYGLEQLELQDEVGPQRRRHAAYYLALAEQAEAGARAPDGAVWGGRLEEEHDNLRAALRWSLEERDAETALRLTGSLGHFWFDRGHLSEGRRWLREALDLPVDVGTSAPASRAKALVWAARLALDQGAYDEAETHCAEAVALARERRSEADLVVALNVHGQLAGRRDQYDLAVASYDEALGLARSIGDRAGEAAALTGLGYATTFTGDIARGRDLTEQALTLLRDLGDSHPLAEALVGHTALLVHTADYARADALGAEALALCRSLGATVQMADALWWAGVSAMFQGQHERAAMLHEENLALRRERGDEFGTIQPLTALAGIALQVGEFDRARTLLEETLGISARHDDRWARAISQTFLGHVELATGDPAVAAARFVEGASLMLAIGNPLYLPWCLEGLAGVAAARGAWHLAARLCGARDVLNARLGLGVPPADPAGYVRTLAGGRAALGDGTFAAAHEAGQELSPEQALAEAGDLAPDDACR